MPRSATHWNSFMATKNPEPNGSRPGQGGQTSQSAQSAGARPAILEAQGLTVVFPTGDRRTEIPAVEDFALTIHEGEIVGIVGETGCGKSTAAMALLGLVRPPGKIVSGQVNFLGKDLLKLPVKQLREVRGRDISLIVQDPRGALNPLLRVGEQISNVYRAHNTVNKKEAHVRTIEMLRMVGINDPERRIEAYPHELSGGMAQRVLIATALSSRPKLLVADEPTSGLDVTIQAQILDEMWDVVKQTGSAILLVTQNLGIIANYCDTILVMHEKHIVEQGSVRDFFRAPRHEYSKAILSLHRDEARTDIGPRAAAVVEAAHEAYEARSEPLVEVPALLKTQGAPDPSAPLIEVEELTKLFPVRNSKAFVQAVSKVSFTIEPGETLGLVGESGSGKTTVGRCLLRLVEPTSGEIKYRGVPLVSTSLDKFRSYRSRLQIVFQNPFDSLNPRWSVGDTLKEPLDLHTDLSPDDKKKRVAELMRQVGLDADLVGARPKALSAGKQQRVSIARALATNPEFIVLDEPTSALAPAAHAEIINLLVDLQNQLGLSYLFISHDLSTIKYLCHRVAVMYLSQVVEVGTKEQVFNRPQHPYSKALLASVLFPNPENRRIDRQVRERLEGEIPSPINLPKGCYLYSRCPMAKEDCRLMPQQLVPVSDGRQVRCWRVSSGDLAQDEAQPIEAVAGQAAEPA